MSNVDNKERDTKQAAVIDKIKETFDNIINNISNSALLVNALDEYKTKEIDEWKKTPAKLVYYLGVLFSNIKYVAANYPDTAPVIDKSGVVNIIIDECKTALQQYPDNMEAEDVLYDIFINRKDYTALKEVLTDVIPKRQKVSCSTYLSLGYAFEMLNDYDNAIINYTKAYGVDNQSLYAARHNAQLLKKQSNLTAAKDWYKKCLEISPKEIDFYYQVFDLTPKTEKDSLVELCKKSVENYPGGEDFYMFFWYCSTALECDPDSTLPFFNQLIQRPTATNLSFIYCSYFYVDAKRLDDAINILNDGIARNQSDARLYYELGNTYLSALAYDKAIKCYDKALSLNPDTVFAQHNKAWIFEKLGDYKYARKEWHKALELYKNKDDEVKKLAAKNEPVDANSLRYIYFNYGEVIFRSLHDEGLDKAEMLYLKALQYDTNSIGCYFSLMELYAQKKQELSKKSRGEFAHSAYNDQHLKMLDCYNTGTGLLRKNIRLNPGKYDYVDLGKFYINMKRYDAAVDCFKIALEKDEGLISAYVGLGVAQVRNEEYRDAIKNFKYAIEFDPDDLNVHSNLGDAFRKAEMYEKAEEVYRRILSITPFYVDALVGLGECYKTLGDKTVEDKDLGKAEEYFTTARKYLNDCLEVNAENASKRLTDVEKSPIYYSLGYVKVKLFELKNGRELLLLQSAKDDFKKIESHHDEFFKAQKAIVKIKQKQYALFSPRKAAPLFVFVMSLLVFCACQYLFFFNHYTANEIFSVNKPVMDSLLKTYNLTAITKQADGLAGKQFSSVDDVGKSLAAVIPAKYLNEQTLNSIIKPENMEVKENITEAGYGFFTFGSLVFMVVGLFLRDITRLKVGSIEMDKNVVDNIATTQSLGILK